jgi:hypothetical protein
LIEVEPRFSSRINVPFLKVLDRRNIQIEIWERGAGYTLASGSSSCAAAAVAHRLGFCDGHISMHMPGGVIEIDQAIFHAPAEPAELPHQEHVEGARFASCRAEHLVQGGAMQRR